MLSPCRLPPPVSPAAGEGEQGGAHGQRAGVARVAVVATARPCHTVCVRDARRRECEWRGAVVLRVPARSLPPSPSCAARRTALVAAIEACVVAALVSSKERSARRVHARPLFGVP